MPKRAAAGKAADAPPAQKTRFLPERPNRKTSYEKEEIDGSKISEGEKRRKNQVFDTDVAKHPRVAAAAEVAKVREQLLKGVASGRVVKYNGKVLPQTMTFGPRKGFGSGFYDARQAMDIIRFSPGVLVWSLVEEKAPTAPRKVSAR